MTSEHAAGDAFAHLQRATLELVEVARSGLDVVEAVLADPRTVTALAAEIAALARSLLNVPGPPATPGSEPGAGAPHGDQWPARPAQPAAGPTSPASSAAGDPISWPERDPARPGARTGGGRVGVQRIPLT